MRKLPVRRPGCRHAREAQKGRHAHSGCAVYLGDNFPPEYRNGIFMCNIHGNRLNHDRPERGPTGYVAKHAPDFLFANDSWFRGIAVKCGPDGGLYATVVDLYNDAAKQKQSMLSVLI